MKCSHIKRNGENCKRSASLNDTFCWQHQTQKATGVQSISGTATGVSPKSGLQSKLKLKVIKPYHSVVGVTRYSEGQLITPGNVMGLGHLDLSSKKTDPDAKTIYERVKIDDIKVDPLHVAVPLIPEEINLDEHCHKMYHRNAITFGSIEENIKEDRNDVINLDDAYPGRLIVVSDYISFWRSNLVLLDSNCRRVKPQYPRDLVSNQEMPPVEIYKILNRGIGNLIVNSDDNDPLWYLLKDSQLMTDIYNFIRFKMALDDAYSQLKKPDAGAWNRRDLILIDEVKKIYRKNKIRTYGWRLYTNIISDRYAVEVFETCILVAKLIERFELKKGQDGEYYWVPSNHVKMHDPYEDKDPCRPGVMADIIGRNMEQIFLN